MDSGSGLDLVSWEFVKDLPPEHWHKLMRPIMLDTAGGESKAESTVTFPIDQLGEEIDALVLPSTPYVLSLGRRCQEMGYGFWWPPYGLPHLMLPDGRVIVLYVCDYIPYLTPGCQPERGIVRAPWHAASVYQQHRDELRRELHNKLHTNAPAKTSYIGCKNEKKRFSDLNDNDKRIIRGKDHWQDQGTCWVRVHYEPRTSLFSLSSLKDGKSHILKPKTDELTDDRITYYWEVDTLEP